MLSTAFFTIAKRETAQMWEITQMYTEKWMCYIHTMEYFQPLKRFGNLIHATPWKHYGKWTKLDTKEQILCDCTYMKYLVSVRMKSPGYQVPEGDYGELLGS